MSMARQFNKRSGAKSKEISSNISPPLAKMVIKIIMINKVYDPLAIEGW